MKEIEYENLKPVKKYYILLLCDECKSELNRTQLITGEEIKHNWTMLVMGSGFNAGKCKNGCRSTFSDYNINTELKIFEADC